MSADYSILCVSADPHACRSMKQIFSECGVESVFSPTISQAKELLAGNSFSLVFCEDGLPDGSCREFLSVLHHNGKRIPLVVFSSSMDWSKYLEAMELGAFDVIMSPFRSVEVQWVVGNALRVGSWPPRSGT